MNPCASSFCCCNKCSIVISQFKNVHTHEPRHQREETQLWSCPRMIMLNKYESAILVSSEQWVGPVMRDVAIVSPDLAAVISRLSIITRNITNPQHIESLRGIQPWAGLQTSRKFMRYKIQAKHLCHSQPDWISIPIGININSRSYQHSHSWYISDNHGNSPHHWMFHFAWFLC